MSKIVDYNVYIRKHFKANFGAIALNKANCTTTRLGNIEVSWYNQYTREVPYKKTKLKILFLQYRKEKIAPVLRQQLNKANCTTLQVNKIRKHWDQLIEPVHKGSALQRNKTRHAVVYSITTFQQD